MRELVLASLSNVGDFSEVRDVAYYKEKLEGLPINQVNKSNILQELEILIREDGNPSVIKYLKEVLIHFSTTSM